MADKDTLAEKRNEKRLDEIYTLAQAGAWDGDPRATVLVQAIRDLWDMRAALLAKRAEPTEDTLAEAATRLFAQLDKLYADERTADDTRKSVGWTIGATLELRSALASPRGVSPEPQKGEQEIGSPDGSVVKQDSVKGASE